MTKLFVYVFFAFSAIGAACGNAEITHDYSRLLELIQLDDHLQPLYVFNDFKEAYDKASHIASRQYLNEHPGLIRRIQHKLHGGNLHWKLGNLKHRLLFVPEKRKEYAVLYKNYCRDVIDAVLYKTGLDNPYAGIQTLYRSKPVRDENQAGVMVYIVHNLAVEYVGTYVFSNKSSKKVEIELNGKLYTGDVGAYASTLVINENGAIEFQKDKYTIWQNSADNPYTALMVPAEETLHIALRSYTENAIRRSIKLRHPKDSKTVETIVEEWMAVEESVVGGIVHELLPHILEENIMGRLSPFIEKDLDAKSRFNKYRHLEKGIGLVAKIGYGEAIRIYSNDPREFRDLLLDTPPDPSPSGEYITGLNGLH